MLNLIILVTNSVSINPRTPFLDLQRGGEMFVI